MKEKIVLAVVYVIVAVGMVGGCKVKEVSPPAPSTWSGTGGTLVPDTTPPTVQSTSPTNSATNVSTTPIISATFSESISPSTVNTGTFTLFEGATNVAGVVSLSGTTATFSPSSALLYGTTYTATITTGVTDLAGNPLAVNYSWTFTTTAAPDTTPPIVSSVTPTNGATNVSIKTDISAVFSESLLASSVTTSTFVVSAGSNPVSGTLTLLGGGTVRLSPIPALSSGMTYSATLTTGVQDLAGNALATPYNWTFTTAPAPSITTTTPLPYATENGTYSQTLAATGGYGTRTWSATSLPAWLTLNPSTGNLSGTPPLGSAATYIFDVTVMDADGLTDTQSLSLTVITGPVIGTSTLPAATETGTYNLTLAASGGTPPYVSWSATGLPAGMTFDTWTGNIGGAPVSGTTGTNNIDFTVTDSNSVMSPVKTLTLTVNAVPSIMTAQVDLDAARAIVGTPYTFTMVSSGGTAPLNWSAPGLPASLTIDPTTGIISGTPVNGDVTSSPYSINFTVTDFNGVSAAKTLLLYVDP